ncbi:hypothetical protein COB21_04735 [Candidatus Aerophobetes bacterium]|uniref:Uncharacterized protein n=1 Tax=Aerophobetes bacterium TaxID=2030807 RepID=A0A2A4X0X2_UNCAE|nr:MAG: hypothetical protein COB21_04735 [Candidatus Aerophobetes bacterium]
MILTIEEKKGKRSLLNRMKKKMGALRLFMAVCCALSVSLYSGEREDLAKEIKILKREERVALGRVSFYQHQAFRIQFSRNSMDEVKELQRNIMVWQKRADGIKDTLRRRQRVLSNLKRE